MKLIIRGIGMWIVPSTFIVLATFGAASCATLKCDSGQKETKMTTGKQFIAKGTFAVRMAPQDDGDSGAGVTMGRMSLDKDFTGDLTGTGKGEMLTAMSPAKGSAAYVAIERVIGTVHGRSGSFALVHRGLMDKGAQDLSIVIVPDSGTDALTGITGKFMIDVREGSHFYTLEYILPR